MSYTNASFRIDNVSIHSGGRVHSGIVLTRTLYYVPVPGGSAPVPMRGTVIVENATLTNLSGGIRADIPTNATFQRNSISQIHGYGIEVTGLSTFLDLSLLISRNRISLPLDGSALSLWDLQGATVVGNQFGPGAEGVTLGYVTKARIYHNNFYRIAYYGGWNSGGNTDIRWDDGYPNGGNYWSDSASVDRCESASQSDCDRPDGIWDRPYTNIGAYGGSDRYPFVGAFPDPDLPGISAAQVTTAQAGSPISISVGVVLPHPPKSMMLWYRQIGYPGFESVELNSQGDGTYQASIPAQSKSGSVAYFVLVQDNMSGQSRAPQVGVNEVNIPGGVEGSSSDVLLVVAIGATAAGIVVVAWQRSRRRNKIE